MFALLYLRMAWVTGYCFMGFSYGVWFRDFVDHEFFKVCGEKEDLVGEDLRGASDGTRETKRTEVADFNSSPSLSHLKQF